MTKLCEITLTIGESDTGRAIYKGKTKDGALIVVYPPSRNKKDCPEQIYVEVFES